MTEVRPSFCRICLNGCALKVEVRKDRVIKVSGNPDNPLFNGYTCVKGRAQPDYLYHPDRLLHSLKRMPDGRFQKIALTTAMDEIAGRLREILGESGPRAIASYAGTMLFTSYTTTMTMLTSLMDTIGSPMRFNTDTIDKGGKLVAASLHGDWMAPACGFDEPDVTLLIGINPVVTFTGLPSGNPGQWLKEQTRRGRKLLVIDPRRTYVARRADLHLRPRAGYDIDILACFIRVILCEGLHDRGFVDENVAGVDDLRRCVEPFDPATVGARTGVDPQDLLVAARTFAGAGRGYVMAGTGPHMAGQGTLTEYLVLALQSLCGHWLRAGDRVTAAPTLLPVRTYKAQAQAPTGQWCFGDPIGRLGLRETRAGLPVASLADEILASDDRRVRAMISVGGNPVIALPDYAKAKKALESLDLFVQVDPWMSRSAALAHYVIAPTMPLEVAATTQVLDFLSGWTGYGLGASYAHYTPAIVGPPPGSEVIDDWKFLHGLAIRLDTASTPRADDIHPRLAEGCTTDEYIERVTARSRVALSEVKKHPGGAFFPEPATVVAARDDGWSDRLDVGNPLMMRDLAHHAEHGAPGEQTDQNFSMRLLCRRDLHVYNSSCNVAATNRGKPYNPAFVGPADMRRIGLADGDLVTIRSAHGCVTAIVETDRDLPPGYVSMMFAYGGESVDPGDVRTHGSNPNELTHCEALYDRYTGQPRMSNIPVEITKTPPRAVVDGRNSF